MSYENDFVKLLLFMLMVVSVFASVLVGCSDEADGQRPGGSDSSEDGQGENLPLYYPGTSDNTEVAEAIVLRYYGNCRTVDGPIIFDISMVYHRPITPEDYDQQYEIVLNFYGLVSHEKLQTISYIPPLGMDVESISRGLVVMDINDDGYDDLLLDLGLFGQRYHTACFVYSSGEGYVEVAGFADLSSPEYDVNEGIFIVEEPGEFGSKKYLIIEDKLLLVD